jgi:rhodanese-related sulfurtransferase
LGHRKGVRVLQLLCRISLEPDSCVRRTQVRFGKSGPRVLLVAKFIPGLNAMAAPLAGIIRMGWRRFVLFDAIGSLLWSGAFMVTGYVFSGELERIAAQAAYLGKWLVVLVLAAFAGYVGWKYYNRRRFLRKLRIARITPEELKEKIDSGEDVVIVDLRHALDFEAQPETILGALHMDAAELEEAHAVIPRDREIVLFCACPNEVTAARLALLLRSKGITRIRPLAEGYEGWRSRGFPMSRPKDEPQDAHPVEA